MQKEIVKCLELCHSNTIWDKFIALSDESSPFMSDWFSSIIDCDSEKLLYLENGIAKAAVLLYISEGNIINPSFTIYHSLCFSNLLKNKISEKFRILEYIINYITHKTNSIIKLSFNPKITDVRPFLWHNFGNDKLPKFNMHLKYTAILSLNSFTDLDNYLNIIRENRKRDFIKSLKNKIYCTIGADKSEVLDLYKKTFNRQGLSVNTSHLFFLENLVKNLTSNTGFICTARNIDGKAIAVCICLLSNDTSYSLIIANDFEYRNTGANTLCIINSIFHAKKLGKIYFDFVGANSPHRGDFKLSFNSELTQYLEASYKVIAC